MATDETVAATGDSMAADLSLHLGSSAADGSIEDVAASTQTRPRTRLQNGIHKEKVYTDGTVKYGCFTSSEEP